ncbi:S-linalool synthase-like [Phalaenopsis equestris]|uniref:S-linalool synthase-like n=1 Tax=Phalaenopsis equestris TaxID=78828 RepID=UPI0009E25321|nr:S-linalool synthase-like [Phalaenopsis equestris]
MEHSHAIEKMRMELFSSSANLFALLPVSAYETSLVVMVPDPNDQTRPMFPGYLDWVLRSQNTLGFWLDDHPQDHRRELKSNESQWTAADVVGTLACLIALKTWEIDGFSHKINKGLEFLRDNMEKVLWKLRKSKQDGDEAGLLRRWILMVELAEAKGLKVFPAAQHIKDGPFNKFKLNGTKINCRLEDETIERIVMREIAFENSGSELYRSPSTTACAFMTGGNQAYKTYLQNLFVDCQHGVPPIYMMDKDVIKLCLVDHLERLGCAEHFTEDIKNVIDIQYKEWIVEELQAPNKNNVAFQLYKDSLAFRLLRMKGYQVSPWRFCWFIDDEEIMSHIKDNHRFFLGPMLSIYKASNIAFPDDHKLDKAGEFARQILQMGILSMKSKNETIFLSTSPLLQQEIEHELGLKWLARMDHLEHRFYIERGGIYLFWIGNNAPYCKILQNDDLLQLAIDNFTTRQIVYKKELHELHRWAKDTGLSTMGFGREKTSYCYFAVASSICFPINIDSRKEAAKCATFIAVADDFFDEKAPLDELFILTDALQRWDGEFLTGHSKVIFNALDNLVHDISQKSFKRYGYDVKKILQDAWKEIFNSWLKEAEWARSSHCPSIDQYIEIGKTSVAVQMMIFASCYLTNSNIYVEESCWDISNTMITQSVMESCRLLNDLESYEKEAKDGKPNIVSLYQKENPDAPIDEAITFVRNIWEKKKKELLQLVMSSDSTSSQMPREWKDVHLAFLKLFQMFYDSTNVFDSPTMLLKSIDKAIYEPLKCKTTSEPVYFIPKEPKTAKIEAPNIKLKIGGARVKSGLLSFDSNKWPNQQKYKMFHKQSIACSFITCHTTSYKCMI